MAGEIKVCPKNACNYHCCDFNQNNFIALLPNELNYIETSKISYEHLEVVEDLSN